MYCQIYRKNNCVGCPQEYKDYCQGIKKDHKQFKERQHQLKNYATYMAIMPIISDSDTAQLTANEILDKINNERRARKRTNLYFVHEVMKKFYKYKKINNKIYYYAKIVEPLY